MTRIKYLFVMLLTGLLSISCFRNSPSALSAQGNHIQINSLEELYQFFTYDDDRYPMLSLHRGGPIGHYPENAIETFNYHARQRAVIIECDVRLTKDSALVLMHDNTLNRTTTGKGKVIDHSLDELKKLNLTDQNHKKTPYKIPTLREALNWGKNQVIYTLDVKEEVPYELVIDAIRKEKAEASVVIITYSSAQAIRVHQLAGDLMISASIRHANDLQRINEGDVPDNKIVAFVGTREPEKRLTDLLHQHGIICILGTLGNLDKQADAAGYQKYAEYIDHGADILSTDRPVQAAKALDYYINKRRLTSRFIK